MKAKKLFPDLSIKRLCGKIKDLEDKVGEGSDIDELNKNLGGLRFGVDGDGNYGYYKADDSFVPFKREGVCYNRRFVSNSGSKQVYSLSLVGVSKLGYYLHTHSVSDNHSIRMKIDGVTVVSKVPDTSVSPVSGVGGMMGDISGNIDVTNNTEVTIEVYSNNNGTPKGYYTFDLMCDCNIVTV